MCGRETAAPTKVADATPGEPTVFLVDDDPAVVRSLKALIRIMFPRVEAYRSAAEFIKHCPPERPGCLVLDVVMPGVSGLDLQRRLDGDGYLLPVIFLTGHGNVPMAVKAIQDGAVDFLEKPCPDQLLWQSIRRALDLDGQRRRRDARVRPLRERLASLSGEERRVLDLLLAGYLSKDIARELGVCLRTVEYRRGRLLRKMEARTTAQLVKLVVECRIASEVA